ncbi:uncharacterized protein tnxba [Misgurnus anguillicaudatus]|uniref:uncharacterized protein tnxba n=1 Tax=Misgurnus anguillicaudatus TaxID=75329 RepID=UPI003CCF62C9
MLISAVFILFIIPLSSVQGTLSERKNSTTKSTDHTISSNVPKLVTALLNTKNKNQTHATSSTPSSVNQTLPLTANPAVDVDKKHAPSKNTSKSKAHTSSHDVSKPLTTSLNKKVKMQTLHASKTISVNQTLLSTSKPAVDGEQKHEKKNKTTANIVSLHFSKPVTTLLKTKIKNQTNLAPLTIRNVNQTLSSFLKPAVDGDQKHAPSSENKKNTTKSTANTTNASKPIAILLNQLKNQTQSDSSKTTNVSQTLPSSPKPSIDDYQKQLTSSKKKITTKSTSKTSLNVLKPGPVLNTKVKNQTPTVSSKTTTVSQTLSSTATPAVDDDQKHDPTSEKRNTTKSTTKTSPNVSKPGPVLNTKVKNHTLTDSSKTTTVSQTLSSTTTPAVDDDHKHDPTSEKRNTTKSTTKTSPNSSKTISDNQTPPSSSKPTVDGDQKHMPSLQGASSEKKNTTTKSTPNNATFDVSKPLLNTKTTKQSHATSSKSKVNQTIPSSTKPAVVDVHRPPKDKPAVSSPIKVVITEGCVQKEAQTDSSNKTKTQETELSLKPGSPLVMTHHIKLVPGTCTGGCETEMTALRDRVEFLEKEMSTLKKMCIRCSEEQCPKNCSGQGKCEGGKCVCHQGFSGPDCSGTTCPSNCNKKGKCVKGKCVCQTGYTGPGCSKGTDKITVTVETVTMKMPTMNNTVRPNVTSVMAKPDKTLFVKRTDTKDIKAKPSPTASTIKTNVVKVQSNTTRSEKVILTVGKALLKHKEGSRQQQATKGKTTVIKMNLDKQPQTDLKLKTEENKESTDRSTSKKNKDLKDQPVSQNVTQSTGKKINGTSKVLVNLVKDTKRASNGTTKATTKTVDEGKVNKPNGTSTEKDKKPSKGNITTVLKVEKTSDKHANWTSIESKPHVKQFNRTSSRSSVIGSVEVHNITSTGFIMSWEAPLDIFKNFTVTRREIRPGNDVEDLEKIQDGAMKVTNSGATAEDIAGVQSLSATKIHGSKLDGRSVKKFSHFLPGTARSYHFKGLQPQTQYSVSLFGSGPGVRSKIHRLTLYTGPEPPSDLIFSNITETALTVSWMKPKSIVAEFKVTYTNTVTGESGSMSVDSQLSHVLLSKLSAGTTYDITVRSLLETLESEPITASVTTVPDSPTELKVMNITDTKALLAWKPSQAKVDSYILSYGSTKSPNVTVTVTLSGSTVGHQLRGLQRSSLHTVKITSQVNRLQSRPISTTFTTGSGVKLQVVTPYEVTFHSAVISWKAPRVVFKSYRLTYQPTEEVKEVILNPSVTQYELTGLIAFTNYTVKIEGERDGQYLDFVSAEFTTAPLPYPYPTDCSEVQMNGVKDSGEVEIYPEGKDGEPVWVYCDMETDEGGWTVFQRRMDGSTDFFRNWRDYSKGFGLLSGEFWLGNAVLHTLTSLAPMSLRIDLRSGNETAYAYYDNFNISSEADHYAIELSGYSGTAGDSMRYHNGRPFSTKDKDPDILSIHCAKAYMGGWWYKNCYKANLNGLYGSFSDNKGVVWIDWKGKDASLPFTEMKLRPSYLSQRTLTTTANQG